VRITTGHRDLTQAWVPSMLFIHGNLRRTLRAVGPTSFLPLTPDVNTNRLSTTEPTLKDSY